MKKIIIFLLSMLLLPVSYAKDSYEIEACIYGKDTSKYIYPEVALNNNLINKKAWEYELIAVLKNIHSSKSNVKAIAYLPKNYSQTEKPVLIINYHWSSKNLNEYKNVSNLKSWAKKYNFILLSVQNMWPLDIGAIKDDIINLEATSIASKLFVESLVKNWVVDENKVFTIWFSAWWLVSLAI